MSIDQGKYICAYTDFGFKRLFGSELNKDILISFLNSFLNLKDKIVDLSYLSLEQLGDLVTDREAIFDVYCKKVIPMVAMTEKPKEKLKEKHEERLSIAKNLKEIGISPKDIFKATGLKEGEY